MRWLIMVVIDKLELNPFPSVVPLNGSTEIYLTPGQYFLGGSGYQVRTLLGSCVAITLWHQGLRFGAMSHFMLSSRPLKTQNPNTPLSDTELDGKYADEVMLLIAQELHEAHIPISECQAKIFGGSNMFSNRNISEQCDIGFKNGLAARRLLANYNIPLVSENLFGFAHREIIFNLANGDVRVRQAK